MRVPLNQPYTISNPFGVPDTAAKFGRHAGIDYAVPVGRQVLAPTKGKVTNYTWGQYHGNTVQIFDGRYYFHLFHNSELRVDVGQEVSEGQVVALSGATGQGITGPHLHYGVSTVPVQSTTSFSQYLDPSTVTEGGNDMVGPVPIKFTSTHQVRMCYESFGIYGVDNKTLQAWVDNPDGTDYALMLGVAPSVKNNLDQQQKRLDEALAGGTTLAPGKYNVQ